MGVVRDGGHVCDAWAGGPPDPHSVGVWRCGRVPRMVQPAALSPEVKHTYFTLVHLLSWFAPKCQGGVLEIQYMM